MQQQTPNQTTVEHPDFDVVRADDGRLMIKAQIGNKSKRFELEEIVAIVLRSVKRRAENALGKMVGKALIVVDGDSANYAFVDRIGKGIGIFYYTFEHAQI